MKDTVLISLIHLTHQVLKKVEKVFLRLVNTFFWRKVGDPDAASACQTISLLLRDDQISEPMARWFPHLGVQFPASFVSALVNRSTKKSYTRLPEWHINDKLIGRNFARNLSLQAPGMLQKSVSCKDIEVATDTVIKPRIRIKCQWRLSRLFRERDVRGYFK